MTQTLPEPIVTTSYPARRRELPSAPVLIRVPIVVASRVSKTPARRRRLRREVRAAGYLLLLAVPACLACLGFGGFRPPSIAASAFGVAARAEAVVAPEGPDAAEGPRTAPAISLSLEPVLAAHQPRDIVEAPVLLSGQLLPVDSHEEPSHGGH